jgi:hypothetical protein
MEITFLNILKHFILEYSLLVTVFLDEPKKKLNKRLFFLSPLKTANKNYG